MYDKYQANDQNEKLQKEEKQILQLIKKLSDLKISISIEKEQY